MILLDPGSVQTEGTGVVLAGPFRLPGVNGLTQSAGMPEVYTFVLTRNQNVMFPRDDKLVWLSATEALSGQQTCKRASVAAGQAL